MSEYYFPFGQILSQVKQTEKSPKKAFVLGVYASAVHARWLNLDGTQIVSALAVASEPEIFWNGENAEQIISKINIPKELGKLTIPTNNNLNGPSGRALDDLYLKPLGLNRNSTWLCDLIPESRSNEQQIKAINTFYTKDIISRYNLAYATIPTLSNTDLNSSIRRQEIIDELECSKADILILLGDLPIYWFLRYYNKEYSKLSQFGENIKMYGRQHEMKIKNKEYQVIPLCHPRQAARLGNSNTKWGLLHDYWLKQKNNDYKKENN